MQIGDLTMALWNSAIKLTKVDTYAVKGFTATELGKCGGSWSSCSCAKSIEAPIALRVVEEGHSTITLTWSLPSDEVFVTYYQLQVSTGFSITFALQSLSK